MVSSLSFVQVSTRQSAYEFLRDNQHSVPCQREIQAHSIFMRALHDYSNTGDFVTKGGVAENPIVDSLIFRGSLGLNMYCFTGGELTLEGSTGMCRPQDPRFQATFLAL